MPVVRKSEFAEMCGVTKGRVSQWLADGQISAAAIVGTGRSAMIDSEIAHAQLKERIAVDKRFGLNGLSTNISTTTISPRPARANAETFRHRIPAEPTRSKPWPTSSPSARRRMKQKPRGWSRPPRRKNCRTGGQPVRVVSAKSSPPGIGGPLAAAGTIPFPAPGTPASARLCRRARSSARSRRRRAARRAVLLGTRTRNFKHFKGSFSP